MNNQKWTSYPRLTSYTIPTNYLTRIDHFGFIRVQGAQATQFLQGQVTCDVHAIDERRGSLAACCDPKGRMIANFFLVKMQEDYALFMPQSMLALTMQHLKKYAAVSRVTLSENTCEIWEYSGTEKIALHPQNRIFDFPRHSHWIIIDTPEPSLTENINWHTLNIESGLAWIYPKTSGLFTPQMINLQHWQGVSFTKGCYTGQEIIARTEHLGQLKRHLYRKEINLTEPWQIGDEIKNAASQVMGIVVAVAKHEKPGILAVLQDQMLVDAQEWIRC